MRYGPVPVLVIPLLVIPVAESILLEVLGEGFEHVERESSEHCSDSVQ